MIVRIGLSACIISLFGFHLPQFGDNAFIQLEVPGATRETNPRPPPLSPPRLHRRLYRCKDSPSVLCHSSLLRVMGIDLPITCGASHSSPGNRADLLSAPPCISASRSFVSPPLVAAAFSERCTRVVPSDLTRSLLLGNVVEIKVSFFLF